ncbi:MAG: hypothetical protein U0166_08075 [Acidobacteriota bacterium]
MLAFLALVAVPASAAEGEDGWGDSVSNREIDRVNEKWSGARCTLRIPIELDRRSNRKGWYGSDLLAARTGSEEKGFFIVFLTESKEKLAGILEDGTVPVGTELVAHGWRLETEDEGLILDLKFADADVKAMYRMRPLGMDGDMPIERLDQVEQYMRLDVFKVAPRDETLKDVPAAPASPSNAKAPATESSDATYRSQVSIVSASVKPARVAPGATIELLVVYEVAGLPPGSRFEAAEERELSLDGALIQRFEGTVSRGVGVSTSSQPIQVPAEAGPGIYTYRVVVSVAGAKAEGTALFEVTAAP